VRSQAGHTGRLERRSGLALAESRPGQRERERERRVSDADASYWGRICGAWTLDHAMPQRLHAKLRLPHRSDPAPSPIIPNWLLQVSLCGQPEPDLFSACAPLGVPHPSGGCHYVNNLIPERQQKSTPRQRFFLTARNRRICEASCALKGIKGGLLDEYRRRRGVACRSWSSNRKDPRAAEAPSPAYRERIILRDSS
jgi:hypothetical protein